VTARQPSWSPYHSTCWLRSRRLSDVEAAALPLAGLTAWQALVEHAGVSAGDRVLVLGAAGGVGSLAVQLAGVLGCQVTALTREADASFVAGLGVPTVFTDPDALRAAALQQPFDVVMDCVGGDLLELGIDAARSGGCFITLQQPPPPRVAEGGVRGVFFVVTPKGEQMEILATLADEGRLRVPVAATFALADGARAFASQKEQRRHPGKTVLLVDAD
jgi:NADPH:quinone reductase-like Zn-dependent oxidoreductase